MELVNRTELDGGVLAGLFRAAAAGWDERDLRVEVRYSRSRVYSGTFMFRPPRIYVNLGRRNRYPLRVGTGIARGRARGRRWSKPVYSVWLTGPEMLALFIFLHEFYHYLIQRAGRNTRCKEAMCDRFAVRYLAETFALTVLDPRGRPVPPAEWLIQDLDHFVLRSRAPAS